MMLKIKEAKMQNKTFWFDVETTGLDTDLNEIIQLAGIIEIDNKIVEEFDLLMKPTDFANISSKALEVQKRTLSDIKTYKDPSITHKKLVEIFDKYINKFDREDKMAIGGYNVDFDIGFLFSFFKRNGHNFLGSYIDFTRKYDPLGVMYFLKSSGKYDGQNCKLETVANEFGIDLGKDAHDALADVIATKEIWEYLVNNIDFKKL